MAQPLDYDSVDEELLLVPRPLLRGDAQHNQPEWPGHEAVQTNNCGQNPHLDHPGYFRLNLKGALWRAIQSRNWLAFKDYWGPHLPVKCFSLHWRCQSNLGAGSKTDRTNTTTLQNAGRANDRYLRLSWVLNSCRLDFAKGDSQVHDIFDVGQDRLKNTSWISKWNPDSIPELTLHIK